MATTVVKRAVKGSPLTVTEHDNNHQNVADTADAAAAAATAANANANTRAPGGTLIAYSGPGRVLAAGDNGNVVRCTSASPVTMTVPAGLPSSFSCVIVQGGAGLVTAVAGSGATLTPVPAYVTNGLESDLLVSPTGTNSYAIYSPLVAGAGTLAALTDIHTYDLATQNDSIAAALLLAGGVVAAITGTRGLGNSLSVTIANGWQGTLQWQNRASGGAWTNISGATSSSYIEVSGDAGKDIRCLFLPTSFFSNILAAGGGGGGSPFSSITENWNTGSHGAPIPAPWTLAVGSPVEFIIGGNGWFAATVGGGGAPALVVRDAGGTNGVFECPLSANGGSGGVPGGAWLYFVFRANAAGTQFCQLMFNQSSHRLVFSEWDGVSATNNVTGTFVVPSDATRTGIKITVAGASLTVQTNSGSGYTTDLTATMVQFLTNQFVGVGDAVGGGFGAEHGPIVIAP